MNGDYYRRIGLCWDGKQDLASLENILLYIFEK